MNFGHGGQIQISNEEEEEEDVCVCANKTKPGSLTVAWTA